MRKYPRVDRLEQRLSDAELAREAAAQPPTRVRPRGLEGAEGAVWLWAVVNETLDAPPAAAREDDADAIQFADDEARERHMAAIWSEYEAAQAMPADERDQIEQSLRLAGHL